MPLTCPVYPRGSEWRKWDLHVHTPASVLESRYEGKDEAEKWTIYINALQALTDIAVIGVTDYCSCDGYYKLLETWADGRLPNGALLLPCVELRIVPSTGEGHAINLHAIFSPKVAQQLQGRFFSKLAMRYGSPEQAFDCTRDALIRLGRAYRADLHMPDQAAFAEGVLQFKVSLDALKSVFDADKDLRSHTLIVVAEGSGDGCSGLSRDSGLAATRESLYQFANMVFDSNQKTRDYFLGRGVDSPEVVTRKCGKLMPCVHGSDAHSLDTLCKPAEDRFCWIKADPTFDGLRQVLSEPSERIWIGPVPPLLERVKNNPRRFLRMVEVRRKATATTKETWFDNVKVELNPGMVAVIGNKGSGKSALSDIIGLLGGSHVPPEDFAFLHEDRFRGAGQQAKAQHFEARLLWEDDALNAGPAWTSLDANVDPATPERLRYIPQKYFEALCNELDRTLESHIEKVIYDTLRDDEKGDAKTLEELIALRRDPLDRATDGLKVRISAHNKRIAELERLGTVESRRKLEEEIKEKEREIASLPPPDPVDMPAETPDPGKSEAIEALRNAIPKLEGRIARARRILARVSRKQADLSKATSRIRTLGEEVTATKDDVREALRSVVVDVDEAVRLVVDERLLESRRKRIAACADGLRALLDETSHTSIVGELARTSKVLEDLQAQLSEPHRKYQAYLALLKSWEERKAKIEGDQREPEPGTLRYTQNRLAYIRNDLSTVLARLREERLGLAGQLHEKKLAVLACMKELYRGVESRIAGNELIAKRYPVQIEAALRQQGLHDGFLDRINASRIGTFHGTGEGAKQLDGIAKGVDFSDKNSTLKVLGQLVEALETNMQERTKAPLSVDSQVKGGQTEELYDYLFQLEYLQPVFQLTLDGRRLNELTPGEKGYMLIVFYLFLDRENIPLVIDQPEENLDNQSVFELMLPCLRDAKQRRQLIVVTHNPNLAVVCDADQVIRARINKTRGYAVTYSGGSIESPDTNADIVQVLEGTLPAFDNRDTKYDVTRSHQPRTTEAG